MDTASKRAGSTSRGFVSLGRDYKWLREVRHLGHEEINVVTCVPHESENDSAEGVACLTDRWEYTWQATR